MQSIKQVSTWFIVEVQLDGRYHGTYLTCDLTEEDARDCVADNCIDGSYDVITLSACEYTKRNDDLDKGKWYDVDLSNAR